MTVGMSAAPTGVERLVSPDELFFSTTDRRGRIRTGNSVFVRISQFSLAELTGVSHNLVRHPGMPAGAYRLLWEHLLAGRPMGAYMQNLAKDGSHYWVFASVTPLGEGFLSVRMAPRGPLFESVKRVYAQVSALEREAVERDRVGRLEMARIGAEQIEELLRPLGFDSYDAFILETLPAEVAARGRLIATTYTRSWARGPIREVLAGAGALEAMLADLVERLEEYRLLCERLHRSSARVLDIALRLDRAVSAARHASTAVADSAPVLMNVAHVMAVPMHTAVTALGRVVPRLDRLRAEVADLRFRIALANLHNDMAAAFAAEVADGVAPPTSLQEVPALCDAVHDGVVEMSATARLVNTELRDVALLVDEASGRLDEFRRFLGQWRILVMRHRAAGTLGELLRPIDEEIATCQDGMELLRGLGAEFTSATVPVETSALEEQVAQIRAAAG